MSCCACALLTHMFLPNKILCVFTLQNLARQTERNETIAAIGEDLFAIAVDQPFRCGRRVLACLVGRPA